MKYELLSVMCYLFFLSLVVFYSYKKQLSATDFIIGNRSTNYFVTALAAHASDMSSWLFMGYPAIIFINGLISAWSAIGLVIFMFLNWQFIAPKIRIATEQFNSLTISSFFEKSLADHSGLISMFTALMCLCFYTIYISAGLVGLGLLIKTLFGLNYDVGIFIGIFIVIPYVFVGGYLTLAWIDFFQGLFLMCVIVVVPLYILSTLGGNAVFDAVKLYHRSFSLFPQVDAGSYLDAFFITVGWGLGYFGQPHIITKFMGIKNVLELKKSQYIGMSWMILSLSAATLVGLVGITLFKGQLPDPEQIFIVMVKNTFHPFLIGFILCAILAATINAMSSQILVLSSSLAEDFYKKIFHTHASSQKLLFVSRVGVILVAIVAFIIAYAKTSTIYSLVLYAWSGLGASFGPLLILILYSKKINKYGAWVGIIFGGLIAGSWPFLKIFFPTSWLHMPALLPGFIVGFILIFVISRLTNQDMSLSDQQVQLISSSTGL